MTVHQASKIQISLAQLEFPFFYETALQFALFRTYGIPSISSLLAATQQLSSASMACKRYADTVVLIGEFLANGWGSERWADGVTRMNCIHGHYRGKIRNEDMLYTLSLFVGEPVRWIGRWEWRSLSDVEKCAIGVFWRRLGDTMGIEYKGLPGYERGTGWKDGLEWMEELMVWGARYEEKYMVPSKVNWIVAEQTTRILLWPVPSWGKELGKQAVCVMMDDRLRKAMM